MSWTTINFFKYDPDTDASQTFNIRTALNNNWDHAKALLEEIRTAIGTKMNSATWADVTLASGTWNSAAKTYSLESTYPFASYDIELHLAPTATTAQYKAWAKASINCGSKTANVAKAYGTVPAINIPVLVKVVAK